MFLHNLCWCSSHWAKLNRYHATVCVERALHNPKWYAQDTCNKVRVVLYGIRQ
jgi:hypothetical protein